ncbi:MAG: PaaI family thioesterase [Deltaproteobacteria bacterium]|nr:PaaI family thioesterase [Deltaproteobacteria bacterium]
MKLLSDGKCFVCGRENPQGLQVSFEVNRKAKTIKARYRLSAAYQGYAGIIHGGVLALLLDEAMVKLAWELGLPAVTGEITVRFPAPLSTEEEVEIVGRILREDRRILLAEAHAEDPDGTVVAEAHGRLFRQSGTPPGV